MSKIKIQAEGKNCQAAYNINNYGVSRVHLRDLCDWVRCSFNIVGSFTVYGYARFLGFFVVLNFVWVWDVFIFSRFLSLPLFGIWFEKN